MEDEGDGAALSINTKAAHDRSRGHGAFLYSIVTRERQPRMTKLSEDYCFPSTLLHLGEHRVATRKSGTVWLTNMHDK